jgi:hypothetical protein
LADLDSTLFWLRLLQLLLAIPLLALVGQGLVWVLARAFGQPPAQNFFYRLLQTIASPVVKACRWISPRFVADGQVPWVALSLLAVAYVWTMIAIANVCIGAGLGVAQCLRGS